MQLEIRRQNIRLDDGMVAHIERQMEFALGQFETWLQGVQVSVEDVNGPKGGVDKQCRVLVNLRSGKTIKVEDLDADLVASINRAADRVSHAVRKEIDRKRSH